MQHFPKRQHSDIFPFRKNDELQIHVKIVRLVVRYVKNRHATCYHKEASFSVAVKEIGKSKVIGNTFGPTELWRRVR